MTNPTKLNITALSKQLNVDLIERGYINAYRCEGWIILQASVRVAFMDGCHEFIVASPHAWKQAIVEDYTEHNNLEAAVAWCNA